MNYIELINQFWMMRRSKRITSSEADLYFYLLKECNERNWENPFSHPNMLICATIGCSEKTLIEVRNRLKQKGLIDFESGERRLKNPVYKLLYCKKVSKEVSKPVSKEVSKKPDINIKLNETKLDNNSPKPPNGDLPSKKDPDFIDRIIEVFASSFSRIRGIDYTVTNKGKERSAAAKILKIYKDKYPNMDTESTLAGLQGYFEKCIVIQDNWLNNNMSLPMIINKFNEINNILKNGNKRPAGKQPATTDEELAGIFAKHFATDYTGK